MLPVMAVSAPSTEKLLEPVRAVVVEKVLAMALSGFLLNIMGGLEECARVHGPVVVAHLEVEMRSG